MQMLGFTLATKQPSMTAAALAGSLKDGGTHPDRVVTMVARLVRSQLAAAAGNVILVIPAAYLLDMYIVAHNGRHVLSEDYANKTIMSLHPTQSGTIPYAALTGVILWLSSIAAGWLENWAVYRRLPEAIAEHRIRRFVGHRATAWASRAFARNISGVGGNFAIGAMLGFVGIIGVFAGAPLEARHVTLSTGSLTFAVTSLGTESLSSELVHAAVLGIAIILALNLTVSFALAFIIALRAREVTFGQALRLVGIITLGFVKSPFKFFLPVEKAASDKPSATTTGHGHH
jgi:site-specific recombinase